MEIAKHIWTPPSRPCSFCLCLQGGSVFADFDFDSNGRVFLVRISFDGYGCCTAGARIAKMPLNESRTLIQAVDADDLDRDEIRDILCRYFQQNDDLIWRDALEEHELIHVG